MKKLIILIIGLILVSGLIAGYYIYSAVSSPIVEEECSLYIHENTNIEEVKSLMIENCELNSVSKFELCASLMKWKNGHQKAGHYVLTPDLNNRDAINLIRSGRRTPITVTMNNLRKVDELAALIQGQMMMDSSQFSESLYSFNWDTEGHFDSATALCLFIPNSYEIYWSSSPEQFVARMKKEHNAFWNSSRQAKLHELGLSSNEVYTLASIVEKESNSAIERPIIASLYLNRLKRGIPLQADPTVVYANNEFGLRRVLNKHLEKDSPYNTYKYAGLPPGPIYMSSINSIEAVLNAPRTNYLYMCAKPNHPGEHNFASTLSEHNRNAAQYHRWLNQRGIK